LDDIEVILVALLVSVTVLSAAARAIDVPYPIVMVIGGVLLGLVPGLPDVQLTGPRPARHPPAAALYRRVLLQPARRSGQPAADLLLSIPLSDRDGGGRGGGRARVHRRPVVAGLLRARRDRRADRPGRGDGDHAPARRPRRLVVGSWRARA
jgi:hypothetical protein